jgi:hypothetical protein
MIATSLIVGERRPKTNDATSTATGEAACDGSQRGIRYAGWRVYLDHSCIRWLRKLDTDRLAIKDLLDELERNVSIVGSIEMNWLTEIDRNM